MEGVLRVKFQVYTWTPAAVAAAVEAVVAGVAGVAVVVVAAAAVVVGGTGTAGLSSFPGGGVHTVMSVSRN